MEALKGIDVILLYRLLKKKLRKPLGKWHFKQNTKMVYQEIQTLQ